MHFLARILALIALLASNAPAGDAKLNELSKRWLDSMRKIHIPGAVVVAVRGNEILLIQSLGLREIKTNRPVTPDTTFYIASCTKSFVATAVMSLAEEGKIDLDAPVKKYLPQFQIADSKLTEAVTIRDLLCHKYGIDSDHITFAEAYSGLINDEMFYTQLKNAQAQGSFKYSNLHYTILGRVIQKVTGMSWKDFLAERIFKPAAMTRATAYASKLYGTDDTAMPYAYIFDGKKQIPAPLRKTDRTMHAAGGMGCSARDVARWLILSMSPGEIDGTRIISEASAREMQKLYSEQRGSRKILWQHVPLGYGLGWAISEYRGHKMVGHNGGYVGAAAHISFLPDEKIGVAVFANTDGPAGGWVDVIAAQVYDRLLDVKDAEDALGKFEQAVADNTAKRPPQKVLTDPSPAEAKDGLSQHADAYLGKYGNPELGEVEISLTEGKLKFALGEIQPAIISDGTNRFKPYAPGTTIRSGTFEVSPDGKVTALHITFEDGEEARFARQ